MARSRHANRTRIFDENGNFEKRESEDSINSMYARGEIAPKYEMRGGMDRFVGYQRVATASGSPTSQATVTFAEMLANVGLSRFRFGQCNNDRDVSIGRERFANDKAEEFGSAPSHSYRGKALGYSGIAHPGYAEA